MVIFQSTPSERRGTPSTHMGTGGAGGVGGGGSRRSFTEFSNDATTSNGRFVAGEAGNNGASYEFSETLGRSGHSGIGANASGGYLGVGRATIDSGGSFCHGTVNGPDHSGLEGYGRYLGVSEVTNGYTDLFDDMDTSDNFRSNISHSSNQTDSEPLCGIDRGLEDYGRYLGSGQVESFSDHSNTGSFEFSNGSLSDFEGLGRHSQPLLETGHFGISSGLHTDQAGYSNPYGCNNGRLF